MVMNRDVEPHRTSTTADDAVRKLTTSYAISEATL